jgi:hypothetical protein
VTYNGFNVNNSREGIMHKTVEQLKAKMEAAEKALEDAQNSYDSAHSSEERSKARQLIIRRGKAEAKAQNAYYAVVGLDKRV